LLYRLLKIPAVISFWLYCRKLRVNNKDFFKSNGPLLIASNHPNSFLDAIILSSLFKRPVYSLARGDAFKNKFYGKLLRSLNMFPVYRSSEGVENMEHNYTTFDACKEVFKKNGIVLIFCEGRCINEWHLRPLKKGTARLAINSWQDGIPLNVLPTALNYQSFSSFGKNVDINFGNIITKNDIDLDNGFGKSVQSFNQKLQKELAPLVYEIESKDRVTLEKKMAVPVPAFKKILLAIPAIAGYILHKPLFYPIKKIIWSIYEYNDHSDSIHVGIMFLIYPLYLLGMGLLLASYLGSIGWLLSLLLLPFCGWSYLQLKQQF
jgi:1-acyl-sn-glycerol-3-phosphate acyltransferase